MCTAVQQFAMQVVLGVVQTRALDGLPLWIVGTLGAGMSAGTIHRDVAAASRVNQDEVDLAPFINDAIGSAASAKVRDACQIDGDFGVPKSDAGWR
jgi:hypothetical protein